MAFVKTNKSKGREYYSISESYREEGKVKHRTLEYIGSIDELKAYALKGYLFMKAHGEEQNKPPPFAVTNISVKTYSHGATMAMFWASELLGFTEIVDTTFTTKWIKGFSRGELLNLAMIQRAVNPGSKRAFANWIKQTSLPYYLCFDPEDTTSQSFWEAMDGITKDEIRETWGQIVKRAMDLFGVDLSCFHLDYSNYFTFINSKNGRCLVCKRGHNKQKRDDLRQFSLAVLTAMELQIPIVWDVYEGNKNDKSEFPDFIELINTELCNLGIDLNEITITFDGGSNSEENFSKLKCHFICSHSLVSHKELLKHDLKDYETVQINDSKTRLAYRVDNLEFSGMTGTGILTYSEELMNGQIAELKRDEEKAQKNVDDINERLKKNKSRLYTQLKNLRIKHDRDKEDIIKHNTVIEGLIKEALAAGKKVKALEKRLKEVPEWNEPEALAEIINQAVFSGRKFLLEYCSLQIITNDGKIFQVALSIDKVKREEYINLNFGKKLTVTDHSDWTTAEILKEYGEQECIENGVFRVSKDIDHFAIRPQFHWTDDKIEVHTFCCLSALAIAEVLRKLLQDKGIVHTKASVLNELYRIRDGWVIVSDNKPIRTIETLDEELNLLWKAVIEVCGVENKDRGTYIGEIA